MASDDRHGWAPLDDTPGAGDADRVDAAGPESEAPGGPPGAGPAPPPAGPPVPPPPPGWVAQGTLGSQPWGSPWGPAPAVAAGVAGDARTGPLPMRPMSVSDILDGAFKLFKANARTVLIIVAVITLPVHFLTGYALRGSLRPFSDIDPNAASTDAGTVVMSILATLLSLLVTPFIAGAIARVVAASYLGRVMGPGEALKVAARRFLPLLGAFILVHLLEFSGVIACGIGLIVTMPAFMALFVLTAPAIVVEDLGPIEAMRRSWRLVRPRFWPVLGTALLAGFIAWVIANVLQTLPGVLAITVSASWIWIVVVAFGVVASLITEPIVAIVATLLYFDARIRHEGFDLELMASDLARRSHPVVS